MQTKRGNGSVCERSPLALLLIDVINRLDFNGGDKLLESAMPMAHRLAALKKKAKTLGIPAIYVNDNFGRWKSDFRNIVDKCLSADVPGRPLAEVLKPEPDDYFVLKPKHSGFFGTPLSILLEYLGTNTLIVTGIAGNNCVLFTAHDAYLRNFRLIVPRDCIASETEQENTKAIDQMRRILKASVPVSSQVRLSRLLKNEEKLKKVSHYE
jgi:nicotinamidase-related amidase